MPVTIRVGVSRKNSKDFSSRGHSLEITSELPIGTAQDPSAMAQATNELFQLAEDLIQAQVEQDANQQRPSPAYSRPAARVGNGQAGPGNGNGQAAAPSYRRGGARAYAGNGNGTNGNGHGNGSARSGVPGITQAQAKAIESIAAQMNESADRVAQDEFGQNVNDLTIRQASELIDLLKKQMPASNGQGGR